MRTLQTQPRKKLRQSSVTAMAGIAHWPLDDAAGTTVDDFYNLSNITWSEVNVEVAPILKADQSALGGGRRVSTFGTGASTAGQRTALAGEWTFEWTGDLQSLTLDAQTFLTHRGTGGTSTSNALIAIQTRTDGRLRCFWHSGTLNVEDNHSDVGAITTGLHYIVVRKKLIGSSYYISFFVDGVHKGTSVEATNAADGSAGAWVLGAGTSAGVAPVDAKTYECRVVGFACLDSYIRENTGRIFRTYDYDKMYRSRNYSVIGRVLIEDPESDTGQAIPPLIDLDQMNTFDAPSWQGRDLPFVQTISVTSDVDSPGATGEFTCLREMYEFSIAPGMVDHSPISSGTGLRVLEISRRVQFEVAILPLGTVDAVEEYDWIQIFDGFISVIDSSGPMMRIRCRDRIAPVQWTFCRPLAANSFKEKVYGDDSVGVNIETVMQSIIDDHVPSGGIRGGTPSIYTPTSPAWALRRRSIGFVPLADALVEKSDQIGYVLRHRWDDHRLEERLTFYEPDRVTPAVNRTFGVDEYVKLGAVEINEETIRNVCEVVYTNRNGTVSTLDDRPRARVSSSDSTSIGKYGERYCQIAEDAAGQIDTSTEATILSDAVVADLAEPKASVSMEADFLHFIELGDNYEIETDGLHFGATEEFAVTSYSHVIDGKGAGSTTLGLRGTPVASVDRRLEMLATPGNANYAPFLGSDPPASITVTPGERLATVTWAFPVSRVADAADLFEVHMTTASGAWTPDTTTLKAVTRTNKAIIPDLDPSLTYQTKLLVTDQNRNRATAVAAASSFNPDVSQADLGAWLIRRSLAFQGCDDAPATSVLIGISGTTEQGTVTTQALAGGFYTTFSTGAVINTDAGLSVSDTIQRRWTPAFSARVQVSGATNVRVRVGLFDTASSVATLNGSNDPNVDGFGFFLDSADDQWRCYANGGSSTFQAVGPVVGALDSFFFAAGFIPDSNTLAFFIDGALVHIMTSGLPATTTSLVPRAVIRNTTAATQHLAISRFACLFD